MVAPYSKFYGKICVGFCPTTGKHLFSELHFKANRESIGSSKKWYQDFQNNPSFQRSACFYVAISGNFKRFQYSNFETDFLENGSLFQKTGVPFFSWISTKIENVSLPYKTVYQKPMVRQIEWWVQNGPITKNGVYPVTTLFIFWKFYFSIKTSWKELIWCTKYQNTHTPTLCKRQSFIWRCFFPCEYL